MTEVFVVMALTDYESSTVMAAFNTREEANQYIADYESHCGFKRGQGYHAKYDDYAVVPVAIGERPFEYNSLADHKERARSSVIDGEVLQPALPSGLGQP